MTEAEWLAETRPERLVNGARQRRRASHVRKYRLLMCAACRELPPALLEPHLRTALDTAERFADGVCRLEELTKVEVARVHRGQMEFRRGAIHHAVRTASTSDNSDDAERLAMYAMMCLESTTAVQIGEAANYPRNSRNRSPEEFLLRQEWPASAAAPRRRQVALIRDIFGNPFRPVAFDPRWRSADAVGLARGIYEDRAFDRLPLLADALMDAGCDEEQVLAHCHSDGPHVRGCWVVDLVLGKE